MTESSPPSTTTPIYADRASGENFLDPTSMINAYLRRFARRAEAMGATVSATLDDSGYAEVRREGLVVGVNVIAERGVLMVFAPIMTVPITGREAFYRELLELSFIETSDASFALNRSTSEVVVRCLRRLSALDYEEFDDIVATVTNVASTWQGVLSRRFGT